MKYTVILYPSDQGFAVNAPDLPGCWSQGQTKEEALENISSAIQEYLDFQEELAGKPFIVEPSFVHQIEIPNHA
jgi:predicted RNase H-like HicB family nuclease